MRISLTARPSPAERLASIELAATRLFAQRGYAATTIDDIVAAADLTKPMLYRHFESKQELCVSLLERYRSELIAAPLSQFVPGAVDPEAQLGVMIEAWVGYVEDHPDAARLLFTPITGDHEVERVQRALYLRQRATQVALLREFVPSLSVEEAEPLAEALRAGLAAVALWWLDHPQHGRDVPTRALLRLTQGTVSALSGQD